MEGLAIHWSHVASVFLIFVLAYFLVCLPLFQRISLRMRGRRFTVRLGTPWRFQDPEHRWDVLMSFLSFTAALALAMWGLDLLMRGGFLPELGKK